MNNSNLEAVKETNLLLDQARFVFISLRKEERIGILELTNGRRQMTIEIKVVAYAAQKNEWPNKCSKLNHMKVSALVTDFTCMMNFKSNC